MIKKFDKEGRLNLSKEIREVLGDNVNVEIFDGMVRLSPTAGIELALATIKSTFLRASKSNRDASKDGRINEFLTSGIDCIIAGLEGICCEYDNKKMNPDYVAGKIHRIKCGIEDLENLLNVIKKD